VAPDDDGGVEDEVPAGQALLALYDRALPQVYGYLFDRCRDVTTAEDLTSETFLAAAAAAVEGRSGAVVSIPWMIGIARHKLVDHWRRRTREERLATAVAGTTVEHGDPWDAHLDGVHATDVLGRLGGHHRAALTLRYVDDLPVPQVAELLGRTVHATEALLVRARAAYRKAYESEGDDA
jgi:RNA polymerase sigma-70 factor, ECF subfamily